MYQHSEIRTVISKITNPVKCKIAEASLKIVIEKQSTILCA